MFTVLVSFQRHSGPFSMSVAPNSGAFDTGYSLLYTKLYGFGMPGLDENELGFSALPEKPERCAGVFEWGAHETNLPYAAHQLAPAALRPPRARIIRTRAP